MNPDRKYSINDDLKLYTLFINDPKQTEFLFFPKENIVYGKVGKSGRPVGLGNADIEKLKKNQVPYKKLQKIQQANIIKSIRAEIKIEKIQKPTFDQIIQSVLEQMNYIPKNKFKPIVSWDPSQVIQGEALRKYIPIEITDPEISKSENLGFDNSQQNKIVELLRSSKVSDFEVEARIGYFSNFKGKSKFNSGVLSYQTFDRVRKFLDRRISKQKMKTYKVTMLDNYFETGIRKIEKEKDGKTETEFQIKEKFKDDVDNTIFGFRISKAKETKLDENDEEDYSEIEKFGKEFSKIKVQLGGATSAKGKKQVAYTKREIKRVSFIADKVNYDLSVVSQKEFIPGRRPKESTLYEIEIERTKKITKKALLRLVREILEVVQNTKDTLMSQKEIKSVVERYNQLMRSNLDPNYSFYNPVWLVSQSLNKPIDIGKKDYFHKDFSPCVTVKLNGIRSCILIDRNGIYMLTPPFGTFKIGKGIQDYEGTLIECEFMDNTFYAFDVLVYSKENVMGKIFIKRINSITIALVEKINENLDNLEFKVKEFFCTNNVYKDTQKILKDAKEKYNDEQQDGLIFQYSGVYRSGGENTTESRTFKWKPKKDLTIDFKIKKVTNQKTGSKGWPEGTLYQLVVGSENKEHIQFIGNNYNRYSGFVSWSEDLLLETIGVEDASSLIVECYWDDKIKMFFPYRTRGDKNSPNLAKTAEGVWERINDPLIEKTIFGKDLVLMRFFHNKYKKQQLGKYFSNKTILLDIGTGRGGDYRKWESVGIKKVFGIEPNKENISEIKKRYGKPSNLKIINTKAENTEIIKSKFKGTTPNGCASFASMTFMFENSKNVDKLVDTISLISQNSFFIGMVMDSQRVLELLGKKDKFDCSAFSIQLIDKPKKNGYGGKILINIKDETSMVKDQEEYLVDIGVSDIILKTKKTSETSFEKEFKKLPSEFQDKDFLMLSEEKEVRQKIPSPPKIKKDSFVSKMEKAGFSLLETSFLDNGNDFDSLPKNSKIFSRLFRTFVFQKNNLESEPIKTVYVDDQKAYYKTKVITYNTERLVSTIGAIHNEKNPVDDLLKYLRTEMKKLNNKLQNLKKQRKSDVVNAEMEKTKTSKEKYKFAIDKFKKFKKDRKNNIPPQTVVDTFSEYYGSGIVVMSKKSSDNFSSKYDIKYKGGDEDDEDYNVIIEIDEKDKKSYFALFEDDQFENPFQITTEGEDDQFENSPQITTESDEDF